MKGDREGERVGRPTLLATYDGRLDAEQILGSLRTLGYPLEDVSVYYRPDGTDQVIDATTGQVAAGQSLTDEEIERKRLEKFHTLVLMHPDGQQFPSVQEALLAIAPADIKYAGETHAESHLEGVQRQDETVV